MSQKLSAYMFWLLKTFLLWKWKKHLWAVSFKLITKINRFIWATAVSVWTTFIIAAAMVRSLSISVVQLFNISLTVITKKVKIKYNIYLYILTKTIFTSATSIWYLLYQLYEQFKADLNVAERLCFENNQNGWSQEFPGLPLLSGKKNKKKKNLGHLQWLLQFFFSTWNYASLKLRPGDRTDHWRVYQLKGSLIFPASGCVSFFVIFSWVQFCIRVSAFRPLVSADNTSESLPFAPVIQEKVQRAIMVPTNKTNGI